MDSGHTPLVPASVAKGSTLYGAASPVLAAHSMDCSEDRVKRLMSHIATSSQLPECDYAELHQSWVRSPCGALALWHRQRTEKLGFTKEQVDAYESGREFHDPEYRILRRIIGACDGYESVYVTQRKYGLSYSEEEVAAICREVETDARIDRQMKEFIDGCGRVLICLSIDLSI